MNIFILSKCPKRCAIYYVDSHVVKITCEIAQILCSVHIILDSVLIIEEVELYKLSHKNHPCNKWARASKENYIWLYKLFCELCKEYTYRYGKTHLCETKLKVALSNIPKNIPDIPMTDFALAMPDDCKTDDPIKSYRNYYKFYKQHIIKYTKREIPYWLI